MKQDEVRTNPEHKSQGVASATPPQPSSKESANRKSEEKKKSQVGKMGNAAGQRK